MRKHKNQFCAFFLLTHFTQEVTSIFSEGGGETLAKENGLQFLGRIPLDPVSSYSCYVHTIAEGSSQRVGACGDAGTSLAKEHPSSPCVAALNRVVDQLLARVE